VINFFGKILEIQVPLGYKNRRWYEILYEFTFGWDFKVHSVNKAFKRCSNRDHEIHGEK